MIELNIAGTNISGKINDLKTLTKLTILHVFNNKVPITGDIGELNSLQQATILGLKSSKLTGDLAKIPPSCKFVTFDNDAGSVFTWSTRPSTEKIFAIEGNASVTNVDKMLQDLAQCQKNFTEGDDIYYKTISVRGTRTSASDEAVQTLQSKGYTVSIIPA